MTGAFLGEGGQSRKSSGEPVPGERLRKLGIAN